MTAKRFMVDDAGTLIDMQTRDMFDIVEEVVDLLNEQHEENIELHIQNDFLKDENQHMRDLVNENKQLKQQIKELYKMVKYDVDNEIEVYPKTLAKYFVNILKIIGDVE